MRRRNKAFTLLELMLVTLLSAVLLLAIVRFFMTAYSFWKPAVKEDFSQAERLSFFYRLKENVNAAVPVRSNQIIFSAQQIILPVRSEKENLGVKYFYDSANAGVFSAQYDYEKSADAAAPVFLLKADKAEFEYLIYDFKTAQEFWLDTFYGACRIKAVKIKLEINTDKEEQVFVFPFVANWSGRE